MWLFDHSSCHTAYAPNALNARKMNVNPGGVQPLMRDTVWEGRVQRMVFNIGNVAQGLKMVLKERGINTTSLRADDMRKILANHVAHARHYWRSCTICQIIQNLPRTFSLSHVCSLLVMSSSK